MILFKGAIGRAYINLYNPLLPQKDEIEMLSQIRVKEILSNSNDSEQDDSIKRSEKSPQ